MRDFLQKHCMDEILPTDTFLGEWERQRARWNIRRAIRLDMGIADNISLVKSYSVFPSRIVKWQTFNGN